MGASKRPFVALTEEAADEDSHRHTVMFEQIFRNEAVNRSELLNGAKGTHGAEQLSEQRWLSPDDVQLWQAACLLHREPSTEELGTVLKVADALADTGLPSWIDMLARRTLATSWATPAHAAETLGALLPLRPELLRRVFSSCLASATLDTLLQACPPILHPHILSAACASSTLVAGIDTLDALLSALPHAQLPAGEGLLTFRFPAEPAKCTPITPALLAHALLSHRGLTSLVLSSIVFAPAALRLFRSGLGHCTLSSVSSFAVSVDAQPESCVELARCLAALPAVAKLHVFFSFARQQPAAARGELAPFVRAAAAPAVLTQLRLLAVDEVHMQPDSHSCCGLFLPLLHAPTLSTLQLSSGVAAGTYDALLMPLRHLSAIRDLHIDADLWSPAPSRASAAPGGALSALTGLRLSSACVTAPLCAAVAAAQHAQGTLRSLSIEHVCKSDARRPAAVEVKAETAAWTAFFAALRSFTSLQSLTLEQLASVPGSCGECTWSEGLAAALAHLTQLKQLRMHASCAWCESRLCCVLGGVALGDALRRLTALQVLELRDGGGGGALEVGAPGGVLSAVAKLRQLQTLGLCCKGFQWQQVVRLVEGMPALKVLKVTPAMIDERDQGRLDARPDVEIRMHACDAEA